jgi:hypothetical protein
MIWARCALMEILGSGPTRVTHLTPSGSLYCRQNVVMMPSASIHHQVSKTFSGRTQRRRGRREGKNSASHDTASRSREAPGCFVLCVLCASASSPKKSCWPRIERAGPDIQGLFRSRCAHAPGLSPRMTPESNPPPGTLILMRMRLVRAIRSSSVRSRVARTSRAMTAGAGP